MRYPNEHKLLIEFAETGSLLGINSIIKRIEDLEDPDIIDKSGLNSLDIFITGDNNLALRIAARHGHLHIVNRLLEFISVSKNAGVFSHEALNFAAENGHLAIVNCLLPLPAFKNWAGTYHTLSRAALNGHINIVNRLLEIDAYRDNVAAYGNEALQCAAANGDLEIVNRLLEFENVTNAFYVGDDSLLPAIQNGQLEIVNRLLEIEAVRKSVIDYGYRALHEAVKGEHFDIAQRLLELDVIINSSPSLAYNNPVLCIAIQHGQFEIVKDLLKIDAFRNNAVNFNNRALHMAIESGGLELINCLLEVECVRNNAATSDNKALRIAADNGYLELVNRLLEFEVVRNNAAACDNEALRVAAENGHLEVVNSLLEIEAVRNNAAIWDNVALLLAEENGHLEVATRLRQVPVVREFMHNIFHNQQREFDNYSETETHAESIHASVSASAIKLKSTYDSTSSPDININLIFNNEENMKSLRNGIISNKGNTPTDESIKKCITKGINRIESSVFTDPKSQVNLKDLLKLIMTGLNELDKNRKVDGHVRLLVCIYQSETEFDSNDNEEVTASCEPGFFNNLIYSQQSILPEVNVIIQTKADAVDALRVKINKALDNVMIANPEYTEEELESHFLRPYNEHAKIIISDITKEILKDIIHEYYLLNGFNEPPIGEISDWQIIECAQLLLGDNPENLFDYANFSDAVNRHKNANKRSRFS